MGDIVSLLVPLVIFVVIMYFMVIRPQKKQMEEAQNMYDGLQVGDTVVTIGGLHGVIDEVNHEEKFVVLDCEGVYLTFELRSVARVVDRIAQSEDPASAQETEKPEETVADVQDEVDEISEEDQNDTTVDE